MNRSMFLLLSVLAATMYPAMPCVAEERRDWTLIYVMSYDNNLDSCTVPILKGLKAGVVNDKLAVTVLSDRRDQSGMRTISYTAKGQKITKLPGEDITKPKVLREYLDWACKSFPARRYGLVFLDHGGRLDDMCLDEHIDTTGRRARWMSAMATSEVVREWSKSLEKSKLELLFLQQCGRGSIENLYNFRDTVPYILSSQLVVGAPNTYYKASLSALCAKPDMDGKALAQSIMKQDRHYTTYVLIDGEKIGQFPKRAASVVKALLKGEASYPRGLRHCFDADDERNYDLIQLLRKTAPESSEAKRLIDWLEKELIVEHSKARRVPWNGLSTYGALSPRHIKRYSKLPILQTSWGRIMRHWAGMKPLKAVKRFF